MGLWSMIVSLFLVIDPFGNVPIVVSMLKNIDEKRRYVIILRESVFALIAMTVFLFFGPTILRLMDVGQPSMGMAGGVVLFLIGLHMSFPEQGGLMDTGEVSKEPFIVPVAIPLIAGPGTLGMVMVTYAKIHSYGETFVALLTAWIASTAIMMLSGTVSKIMGKKGLEACQRLMGLALTAMAVDMFMNGFKTFMKS